MRIRVNDYRGRTIDPIQAMLHREDCKHVKVWGHMPHWSQSFGLRQTAEAAIEGDVYTCQRCMPGQGRAWPYREIP